MLIEAFERFGHSDGAEMKQKVLKGWFNTVTSEVQLNFNHNKHMLLMFVAIHFQTLKSRMSGFVY